MRLLAVLWHSIDVHLDLDSRWTALRSWLTREDCKAQRLIAVAGSLIFLSLVILLLTTCDGGPQIQP